MTADFQGVRTRAAREPGVEAPAVRDDARPEEVGRFDRPDGRPSRLPPRARPQIAPEVMRHRGRGERAGQGSNEGGRAVQRERGILRPPAEARHRHRYRSPLRSMHLRSIGLATCPGGVGSGPCSRDEAPKAARPRADVRQRRPTIRRGAGHAGARGLTHPPRAPGRLDVVLITIDCLRADMPWAGYPRPIAPRLTELAARASTVHARLFDVVLHVDEPGGPPRRQASRRDAPRRLLLRASTAKENVLFPELLQAPGSTRSRRTRTATSAARGSSRASTAGRSSRT
jgi:hypothetical protein